MATRASAAIVYDFDGTLAPGSMHDHSFLPGLGYGAPEQFWAEVKRECKGRDGDEVLTYMELMLRKSSRPFTAEELRKHGEQVPLFRGVDTWFDRTSEFAASVELDLQHYVVSSGIREMIEGSPIQAKFARVFASSFAYDEAGRASWPAVAINYTTKTQFRQHLGQRSHK